MGNAEYMGDNKQLSMKFSVAVLCISIGLVQVQAGVSTIGPTNGMCVGVNDAASTFSEQTEIYLAKCNGAFSTNRMGANSFDASVGYLKMEMAGVAFVRDGYINAKAQCAAANVVSCQPADNLYVMSGPSQLARSFQKKEAQKAEGSNKYAYSSTGAFFTQSADCSNKIQTTNAGDCKNGFYGGTATYMVTEGSIETKENTFDVAGVDKTACITEIASGTCGAKRTFNKGTFKFSLFGYSISDADLLKAKVVNKNGAGNPFQYIGFRQKVQLKEMPSGATFSAKVTKVSGGEVDVDAAVEVDIKELKLCVGTDKCLQYVFPQKYNVGDLKGDPAQPVVDGNAETLPIKIKVSWNNKAENTLNIDYLMDAAKLSVNGKWFVYDPDVTDPSSSATPAATPGTPAATPGTPAATPATPSTPTPASNATNDTNTTSSASGVWHFSHMALSIPVVAMVISKM